MADYDTSLEKWFENQMPKVAKKLSLKGIGVPPLHVGGKVKVFSPRLPSSPAPGEDQTVPRICCSLSLKNCNLGARHNFQFASEQPRLYFYAFDERSVVQPSVDVTKEPNRAGEVWIVPHRMANWDITPKVIGEMRLVRMSNECRTLEYVMMVSTATAWDSKLTLQPDVAYRFTVTWSPEVRFTDPIPAKVAEYHNALDSYTVAS